MRALSRAVRCGARWKPTSHARRPPRDTAALIGTQNGATRAFHGGPTVATKPCSPTCPGSCSHHVHANDHAEASSSVAAAAFSTALHDSPFPPPPPQPLLQLLSSADSFAQSRVKNYVQRVLATAAPVTNDRSDSRDDGSTVMNAAPRRLSQEEADRYKSTGVSFDGAWSVAFDLPVDVFVNSSLTRRHIVVSGLALDAKMAVIAACMHAERCLDALRIPLFTSERRQRQRIQLAEAEGRTSAEVNDLPRELSRVVLPPPVFLPRSAPLNTAQRLASYQPTSSSASNNATSGTGASGPAAMAHHVAAPAGHHRPLSKQGQQEKARQRRLPRRRADNFSARYGNDVFMQTTLKELALLQASLFAHNRPVGEDDDDDGDEIDVTSVNITAEEESVLRPELLPREDDGRNATAVRKPGTADIHASPAIRTGHAVMRQERLVHHKKRYHHGVDETEGGLYDLVEGQPGEWVVEPEVPGPWCVRDTYAVDRVSKYLQRTTGHSFNDSVTIAFSDEDTLTVAEGTARYTTKTMRWYTATIDLAELRVKPTGKGTTQAAAKDLCAMHAESLLQWFGVPLYTEPHEQARYYDACLRWGRRVAASPVDPASVHVQTASLPRAMKEWYRSTKLRVRDSEMNVMEKLLLLNRVVVCNYRKHFIEGDFLASDRYTEVIGLAEACVRSFMIAVQHPFESAFFCLVYSPNSQFRSTIYLPLPECYGVRGGFSVAGTPRHAMQLCALSAIDVLCALDVIPPVCMAQPRWRRMLELREALGMILPPSHLYKVQLRKCATEASRAALGPPPPPPDPMLRSPPAYRESPGYAQVMPSHDEVWRIMLIDTDVFDVVPSMNTVMESTKHLVQGRFLEFPSVFFAEVCAYLFGWNAQQLQFRQHMHHYTGSQRYRNQLRTAANTFWLELPLERATYGHRVAVGRCLQRRGAERMLCIHALRILRALKLAPWDTWTQEKLAFHLYDGDKYKTQLRLRQWNVLCAHVLDGQTEEEAATAGSGIRRHTPDAVITSETVTSAESESSAEVEKMVHVLSPHPVISHEAAKGAFG